MEEKLIKSELLKRYLDNTITPAEAEELFAWLKETGFEENDEVEEIMAAYYQNSFTDVPALAGQNKENLDRLLQTINADKEKQLAPVRRMNKRWWMAAASIVVLLGIGGYFKFFNTKQPPVDIAKNLPRDVKAPVSHKAMITLADGRKVPLDSIESGSLARENNVNVVKTEDGRIVYSGASEEMAYNTLYNPKGSKVQTITLTDGTQVWINADSKLRYPVAFSGNERKVELSGEGYFEVAKNAAMPFNVSINGKETVQVLGTHFNINAYPDEAGSTTTLLEGAVKITSGANEKLLAPGQQAAVNEQTQININPNADIEMVMAWKNGMFQFKNADLKAILAQVSRWYDVNIIYEDAVTERFGGEISRNANLSQVINILEATNKIKLVINGNTVTVKSLTK